AHHLVDVVLEDRDLSARLDADRPREVALGDRGGHVGDGSNLGGQGGGELVDVVGQVAPRAGGARPAGLAAEPAFHTDLASHARDLVGEGGQGIGHAVDGVREGCDLALRLEGQLALQVAVGDRGDDTRDASHLIGEVGGHQVDVVGEVLPRAANAGYLGLAAELALGAHLAGDTRHLVGEGVELIDHRVDGVLELEDLALDVDRDLLGEVAFGDCGHHAGDSAHLLGELAGHQVDVVSELLPNAGDALHLRLAAELAVGSDLTGNTRDLTRERVELVDHRVDGVLELEDLALAFDRDLLGDVAVGNRGRDLGDVTNLTGEVAGHRVDVVGEVLPRAADALHVGLAAELAFGAHLARDTRHLVGEGVELIDHRVDGVLELEDLALAFDGDLLGEVA